MKKLFASSSVFSLALLLIMVSALISGVKESVPSVEDAAFLPVAAFVLMLSYALGFSAWTTRRALPIVLIAGLIFAFIESARLVEPINNLLRPIPQFELELVRWISDLVRWVFEKEPSKVLKAPPDTSIFRIQFHEIMTITSAFTSRLLGASIKDPSVREILWDILLLLLAAWAGWGTSRLNQTFLALAPTLGLHAFILNYTGKDPFSLQAAVFAFVLLVGINQKWNISREKTENFKRAARETYPVIILLSFLLAFTAGIAPSISFKDVAQRLTKKDKLAEAIGLEKEIVPSSTASDLPRQHLVGLSPEISNTVIFTVKTGELAPTENIVIKEIVPRHYWRSLIYDVYNGQGWLTSKVENSSYSANEDLLPITTDRYKLIHQQIEKNSVQDGRIYWTGSLVTTNQPFNVSWRVSPRSLPQNSDPLLFADMLGAATGTQIYQSDSLVPMISANQLRDSSQAYPQEIGARYLLLPKTVPQRVIDLAKKLTANAANPYDKAKALEAYLRTYPYSLDVPLPPSGRDVADYFLFDLKIGYCDYYATSMVVMARAIGLPARLVIGYSSGIYDSRQAEYVVREANAHSWVEVYFTSVGWVEFEPTASEPAVTLPNELPQSSITSLPITLEHNTYTTSGFLPRKNYVSLIIWLMIGLTVMICISGIWFLAKQGLLRMHRSIGSIYEYIYYHGKKIYRGAPLNETPSIFADKLQRKLHTSSRWIRPAQAEIKLLTELYLQETYSAHPITKDERAHALKVWGKLFWRLLYARFLRL